jgi:hypothetical protein
MRRHGHYIFTFFLLLCGMAAGAQQNNLLAAKKKLILLIDLSSSKSAVDSIVKRAGLKDADAAAIIGGDFSALDKDGWQMVTHEGNVVEFDKPLKELKKNPQSSPYLITTKAIKTEARHGYTDNIIYGVNKFSNVTVYELPSGLTRFFLAGYPSARRVFLSGSFNDWSTLKGLMTKTEKGWSLDLKLQPGAYEYKYITDGHWMTDPENLDQVNDGGGNTNSIYFKYNYTFKLPGFAQARRVTLAGSFNDWNGNDLLLEKKGNSWVLPIYLHEGMHAYRFLVDGQWIIDPTNPEKYTDDAGNVNSLINIGETVNFKLEGYPNAKNVSIAGDFNNWRPNAIKLYHLAGGWDVAITLPAGNYHYKFIVDGEWMIDQKNPNHDEIDGKTNSFLAVEPNHTFKLKGYGNARKVVLAGTFNDWNYNGYTMAHNGDEWEISLYLKPGKYFYKFIVDGGWMRDPGNELWEQNDEGTGNSVLWMEP